LLMILVFRADLGVGIMKYHAKAATEKIAVQLAVARLRAPDTVDLVSMNSFDAAEIFRKVGL
jgi:hypothetical protein